MMSCWEEVCLHIYSHHVLLSMLTVLNLSVTYDEPGTGPNDFEGNMRYRDLVRQVLSVACGLAELSSNLEGIDIRANKAGGLPKDKKQLAVAIVQAIQRRGGRFLQRYVGNEGDTGKDTDDSARVYTVVSDEVAIEKTRQTFRHQMRIIQHNYSQGESADVVAQPSPIHSRKRGRKNREFLSIEPTHFSDDQITSAITTAPSSSTGVTETTDAATATMPIFFSARLQATASAPGLLTALRQQQNLAQVASSLSGLPFFSQTSLPQNDILRSLAMARSSLPPYQQPQQHQQLLHENFLLENVSSTNGSGQQYHQLQQQQQQQHQQQRMLPPLQQPQSLHQRLFQDIVDRRPNLRDIFPPSLQGVGHTPATLSTAFAASQNMNEEPLPAALQGGVGTTEITTLNNLYPPTSESSSMDRVTMEQQLSLLLSSGTNSVIQQQQPSGMLAPSFTASAAALQRVAASSSSSLTPMESAARSSDQDGDDGKPPKRQK